MSEHSNEERLLAGLAALAAQAKRREAPSATMEMRLLRAFQAEHRQKAHRRYLAFGLIAASLALLSVAGFVSRRAPVVTSPRPLPTEAAVHETQPAPQPALVSTPGPTRRARAVATRSPRPETVEVATEFIAIADASMLSPFGSGRVVRVRVPRTAMLQFGLPINENRASELVKADVVLGEDGLARAIRFVQ